jgi:hypothetical protein
LNNNKKHGRGRHGYDVVAAVNSGVVTRVQRSNGRRHWQVAIGTMLGSAEAIPTRDHPALVTLQRIDIVGNAADSSEDDDTSSEIAPAHRPILWTGEEGMVMVSADCGQILAQASFPQPVSKIASITRWTRQVKVSDGVV